MAAEYEFHLDMRARAVSLITPSSLNLGESPKHDVTLTVARDFLSGVDFSEIDQLYVRRRTLASAAVDSIVVNGGPNKDVFGNTLSIVTLCGVIIVNQPVQDIAEENTTNLTLGASGANAIPNLLGGASVTKIIRPRGLFMSIEESATGIGTVTPGTADTITITNAAGATNNYQIIIFGKSV